MNAAIATRYETAADFIPATVPPTTSAYRLGQYAAQLGEDCLPRAFIFRHEQKDYCRGWKDAIAKANESKVVQ